MTGAEIPAAKAVIAAFGEEQSAKEALVAASTETEGFQVAAEIRGQRMALRQAAVLNLMRPLYWCVGVRRKQYFDTEFVSDLASKTASIPEEDLVTPPTYLAGPAIEGLGYAVDEVELKSMFLNLLAAAADGRRTDVHPSYAETIRQLAPDEAELLSRALGWMPPAGVTMIAIRFVLIDGQGHTNGARHVLPLVDEDGTPTDLPLLRSWVENWTRLGLVEPSYDSFRVPGSDGLDPYAWAETWPAVVEARASVPEGRRVEIKKGLLTPTDYGRRFAATVFDTVESQES